MNPLIQFLRDLMYHGLERYGKYYSSYRAFVFRRDDPENLGRVQLFIPHVYGKEPYKIWVFPLGLYSGDGFGAQCIPQIGQMVMVEFEGGDPKLPMWKHGHFGLNQANESEIPAHLRDPDIYFFRTPKGLGIVINEKTGSIEMTGAEVQHKTISYNLTAGTNKIEVTDTGVNITLGDGNKTYIGGKYPVLYSKEPSNEQILKLEEIGISTKLSVG